MNILDVTFCIIVGLLFLRGLYRGLLVEVSSLAGALLGFILANKYSADLAPLIAKILPDSSWSNVTSYVVIFLGAMILITMTAQALKKVLALTPIAWIDHLGGGMAGFSKGVLISCVLILIVTRFFSSTNLVAHSRLVPYFEVAIDFLSRFFPQVSI